MPSICRETERGRLKGLFLRRRYFKLLGLGRHDQLGKRGQRNGDKRNSLASDGLPGPHWEVFFAKEYKTSGARLRKKQPTAGICAVRG